MRHSRVNAMEHPAYNSWSMREKLSMPEVRWAIGKFAVAAISLVLIGLVYASVSTWIMIAVPIFYAEREAIEEEQLKFKAGCLDSPTRMVVFDCHQSSFSVPPEAFLNETITRTLIHLTEVHPSTRTLLVDLMGCQLEEQEENNWCRETMYIAINTMRQHRILLLWLSWLSSTLMLCSCLCAHGPGKYYKQLRHQLDQPSAEGIQFLGMSSTQKKDYITALASPENIEPLPDYQIWKPPPSMLLNGSIEEDEMVFEQLNGNGSESCSSPDLPQTPPPVAAEAVSEDGLRHRPLPRNRPDPKPLPSTAPSNAASVRASSLL